MTTGNSKTQKWKLWERRFCEMSQDMRLHVINADQRDAETVGKTFGKAHSNQEGAHEAGPKSYSHCVYLL